VPPVRLELTTWRVRTACSALELRRQRSGHQAWRTLDRQLAYDRERKDGQRMPAYVPQARVERASPRLQRSAWTTQAAEASVARPLLELRLLASSSYYSVVRLPRPRRVFVSRGGERRSRTMQSARFALRGSNSHFQGQSLAFCQLNEARIVVGLERFELSPRWVKARHAAVTPQTLNRVCGRAFESLLHHVELEGIEPSWSQGHLSYSQVGIHSRLQLRLIRGIFAA
jgi:hypothetical protein